MELLDTEDVTLEQVQAVDEVVLELCSKTPDIPFYLKSQISNLYFNTVKIHQVFATCEI